jgi:nucleotide-binding universal stress UspA family protein
VRKILVGFDGSEESRDALYLAAALAELEGAQVELVAVYLYHPLAPRAAIDHDEEAKYFDSVFSEARTELPGTPLSLRRRTLRDLSPARALNNLAEEEGVDLIVIGSTHRGELGRILPGSVGVKLLQGSPCAVAIAPRGFSRGEHYGLGLIGVAYDASPESELALERAAQLVRDLDGSLRLITAAPGSTPEGLPTGFDPASIQEKLQAASSGVRHDNPGLNVEGVLEEGDPAPVLARQGVELDLLVIGSRGYGPVRRTLLGGVSSEVMRTAPCPVIVVPRGGGADRLQSAGQPPNDGGAGALQ